MKMNLDNLNIVRLRHDNVVLLWIVFFCYSTVAAIFFQKLLLPLIPSLHAGNGLMHHDAILFHSKAVGIAESIKLNGWSSWTIWPNNVFSGNVAIVGLLYALFGYDPSVIVPVNALFHATGGVLIYLLGRELWPGRVGSIGGIIAASLFIVFPSALSWYGQLHKDGYTIAGVLLILLSWVRAVGRRTSLKAGIWLILGTSAGMLLVAFARPYYLKLLFVAGLLLFILLIFYIFSSGILRGRWRLIGYFLLVLIVLGIGAKWVQPQSGRFGSMYLDGTMYADWSDSVWAWQKNDLLPDFLEKYIEVAAKTRAGMIRFNIDIKAGSLIDGDVAPMNIFAVAAYMPRALQISLFAPFPASWLQKLNMMRLVSIFEMVIWYALFPGILLTLYYRRPPGMVMVIVFCLFFLSILGFVSPNVGTLYRIRYAYLFVFVLIGTIGWVNFFLKRQGIFEQCIPQDDNVREPVLTKGESVSNAIFQSRAAVVGTGTMIILLTLLGYIGFAIRDVIMARWFGIGSELDTFFIGSMVPMFLVTAFSIPLGAAIAPAFMETREKYSMNIAQDFVANVAFFITGLLALMCIVLYLTSPYLMPVVGWSFTPDKIKGSFTIMILFLPILLLSGLMIIGNSVSNALGKFLFPGLAQLVVPLVAIIMLFVFGYGFGIVTVAIGMIVGLLLNVLLVSQYLRKNGFSICPRLTRNYKSVFPLLSQYVPLVAAAFFVSAAVPIGNGMASSLSDGSVATLVLGMKVVIFITGIIGSGVATVMVPYFSSFMARKRYIEARRNLSFFLFLVTFMTIPVTVLFYLASADIIRLAFEGGALKSGDALAITRVMRFGIIQLPFFTCGILIMKFATAGKRASLVLISSFIGLSFNIVLNLLLMRHIGVAGIALAITLSMAVSTVLLLILIHRLGHVPWFDAVLLAMSWLLYLTLIICLYYRSYAGIVVVVLAYGFLIGGHWRALHSSQKFATSIA